MTLELNSPIYQVVVSEDASHEIVLGEFTDFASAHAAARAAANSGTWGQRPVRVVGKGGMADGYEFGAFGPE